MTTKAQLIKSRLPEDEVETVAGTVKVRGLSRSEVLKLQNSTHDADTIDQRMLEMALVEPSMSPGEIQKWRKAWTTAELDPVITKIAVLSGMEEEEDGEEARERSFPNGQQ